MGENESYADQCLKESSITSEENTNISLQIKKMYECLQELGYLINDLYKMDMNELESTLVNRRKGIANECFMIGMLSRTAMATNLPDTPEKAFPYMFPPKKKYVMPDFLKDKAIETLKERGVNIAKQT